MLKVLQLIPSLDRSGAEKQMVLLATKLPRDRFAVEVATLSRSGSFEAELRSAGIPVTAISKRFRIDPFALRRLTRFLRANQFDVVQTWLFAASAYGRVAAHLAQVPVVVVAEMAVDLWKGNLERAIDRRLARWCDRVVGNSNAVVDFYRELGVPNDRLAMIYSGADDEPPVIDRTRVRAELGIDLAAPLILFAGRLAEQKCVGDLLKALDLLHHVQPDARSLIVGDGPLREPLEEIACLYRLEDHVQFLGHRDDVPALLAAADVLVLPSAYEGLPNVVLEAMRFRKPVVATAAPGTTEVVVDGVTGLLVPVGDPPRLTRALRDVIRDPALAARMGAAGRDRVENHFRVDAMVDQFAQLYESIHRSKTAR